MPSYRVDSAASILLAKARSPVRDVEIRIGGISGEIAVDPTRADLGAPTASIAVDMTTATAGDPLTKRALERDLGLSADPAALFALSELRDLERRGEELSATLAGTLRWRGRALDLSARGSGRLGASRLELAADFVISMSALGIRPPRFFMIRIEDKVALHLALAADCR